MGRCFVKTDRVKERGNPVLVNGDKEQGDAERGSPCIDVEELAAPSYDLNQQQHHENVDDGRHKELLELVPYEEACRLLSW